APASADETLVAQGYKMAGDASRMRLVLHFDKEPDARWFLLRNPHRLAIETPETEFRIAEDEIQPLGMVTAVNFGNAGQGRSRLILSFGMPFQVERFEILKNETEDGHRL